MAAVCPWRINAKRWSWRTLCTCGKHVRDGEYAKIFSTYLIAKAVVNSTHTISSINRYVLAHMIDSAELYEMKGLIFGCFLGLLIACQNACPVTQCDCQHFVRTLLRYKFNLAIDREKYYVEMAAYACEAQNDYWLKFALKQCQLALSKLYECILFKAAVQDDVTTCLNWYCFNQCGFYKITSTERSTIHARLGVNVVWWAEDYRDPLALGDPYRLFNSDDFYMSELSLGLGPSYRTDLMQRTAESLAIWSAKVGAIEDVKVLDKVDYVWIADCGHQVLSTNDQKNITTHTSYSCCPTPSSDEELAAKFTRAKGECFKHYSTTYKWICSDKSFHTVVIEDSLYLISEATNCACELCDDLMIALLYLLRHNGKLP